MKRCLSSCLLACALTATLQAATTWTEGFEGSFPPAGWIENSVEQSSTYAFNGEFSAKIGASADFLTTPAITNAATFIFWSYTTSSDPQIIVEYATTPTGPWVEFPESPFSGDTQQWNGRWVDLTGLGIIHIRLRKSGSGTLYVDDAAVESEDPPSNQPPTLDPIGSRSVLEGGSLSFSVTASDPVDNDPLTLSAASLPSGATFTKNTFIWNPAAPVGSYEVTFTATDKDGYSSETITINVIARPRLIISEVTDPSGTGGDLLRFVELYNAGTNDINLTADQWHLSKQVNGGTWYDIPLEGTIPADTAWVIARDAASFEAAYNLAPGQESESVSGNGDDAYILFHGGSHGSGTLIDAYGKANTDGTDTAWNYEDSRAVRNMDILKPNTTWTATEWTITSGATADDMTPGQHGPAPLFDNLKAPFVFLGQNLELAVTATNPVRSDIITLSAVDLPSGALFPKTTGTNTACSTLAWTAPPAGTHTVTLRAEGICGSTLLPVTITVARSTQIDGYFRGWQNHRIFALANGDFWQQTAPDSSSETLYRPSAIVSNFLQRGIWRLYVDGAAPPGYVEVRKLTDITRSRIDGRFHGFNPGEFLKLQNGQWWRQTSTESSATPRLNPDVFIWDNTIQMPDEELAVSAEQIEVLSQGSLTSHFNGLHYATLYQLNNGQNRIQVSFENIPDSTTAPEAIQWLDDGQTALLLRTANDETIGSCIVVDPDADADGDRITNAAELIAGTAMDNPGDIFQINSIEYDRAGRAVLNWQAINGRIYTIEWTPSLDEDFQALETNIAPPWVDQTSPPGTGGFYRIRVQLDE